MSEDGLSKAPYPRAAFFILTGYLLERFTYYGFFGGTVFYMQRVMRFTAPTASTVKASLEGIVYLAPIAGAILADTYLGKIRTVSSMCCIYVLGAVIFALSAVSPIMGSEGAVQVTGLIGLGVLGISSGLMKAVYTSLGPDQFTGTEQRRQQQRFFYAFYWMINAGAFIGQLLTAQLRGTVQCFGDDCYLLPYSILCGVMVISTAVFFAGKNHYVESPPDPMFINSVKCVGHAISKSFSEEKQRVKHWLDRSLDRFSSSLVSDLKDTLKVLILFCTYPLFWALLYQTSTGMIFQAKRLNDYIGSYRIPAELSSSINLLLILILIPLFDLVIYPLLEKRQLLKSTTSRMILGMGLAAAAFITYGVVNLKVEQEILKPMQAKVHFYNAKNCNIALSSEWMTENINITFRGQYCMEKIPLQTITESRKIMIKCTDHQFKETISIELLSEHESSVVILPNRVRLLSPTKHYLKDKNAEAKIRITAEESYSWNTTGVNPSDTPLYLRYKDHIVPVSLAHGVSSFGTVSPHPYTVVKYNSSIAPADIRQDGVYDMVFAGNEVYMFAMTSPSSLHMSVILPQYLIITVGEILFSVSAMDFAYSEAPAAMKSVMQAANLFTVTVGIWLFAGLKQLTVAISFFEYRESYQAFMYAGLQALDTLILWILVWWYLKKKALEKSASSVKKNIIAHTNAAFEREQTA